MKMLDCNGAIEMRRKQCKWSIKFIACVAMCCIAFVALHALHLNDIKIVTESEAAISAVQCERCDSSGCIVWSGDGYCTHWCDDCGGTGRTEN